MSAHKTARPAPFLWDLRIRHAQAANVHPCRGAGTDGGCFDAVFVAKDGGPPRQSIRDRRWAGQWADDARAAWRKGKTVRRRSRDCFHSFLTSERNDLSMRVCIIITTALIVLIAVDRMSNYGRYSTAATNVASQVAAHFR
jgi:hypothetical protein